MCAKLENAGEISGYVVPGVRSRGSKSLPGIRRSLGSPGRAATKESPQRQASWFFTSAHARRRPPNGSGLPLALTLCGSQGSEAAESEPQPEQEPWAEQPEATGTRAAARTQAAQPRTQVSGPGAAPAWVPSASVPGCARATETPGDCGA